MSLQLLHNASSGVRGSVSHVRGSAFGVRGCAFRVLKSLSAHRRVELGAAPYYPSRTNGDGTKTKNLGSGASTSTDPP